MSKANKSGPSTSRRLITLLVVLPLLIVILVQVYFLLMVCWYSTFNPRQTNMMSDQLAALQATNPRAALKYEWVPYADISDHLKRAVIASEDDGFVNHDGVDWNAIEKAWERNAKAEAQARAERQTQAAPAGRPVRTPKIVGGSTITQQLAKNLFLSGERTLLRKGQEFALTLLLEALLNKQRILEIYLNSVEWGEGVFGAEAAAQHYFKKSAARLTAYEAARMAVMLPRPRHYEKLPQSPYLASRAHTIVARMGDVSLP